MSGYEFQAKATEAFGVMFRSQLEAEWAYWFHDMKWDWNYLDAHWADFTIRGESGKTHHVEIKPKSRKFFDDAMVRVPQIVNQVFIIQGRPYGTRGQPPLPCIDRQTTDDMRHPGVYKCSRDGNRWAIDSYCSYEIWSLELTSVDQVGNLLPHRHELFYWEDRRIQLPKSHLDAAFHPGLWEDEHAEYLHDFELELDALTRALKQWKRRGPG